MGTDDREALRERAEELIRMNPEWYHSIELAPGVITPGRAPLEVWLETLRTLDLPDLRGKSVLDIGAYDGFFSLAAERLGAARIVALDEYVWCTDMVAYMHEWRSARDAGTLTPSPRNSGHWRPEEIPGKRAFYAAHQFFESRVQPIVGNFMAIDRSVLGQFDVVLFLGILYHMENPLEAVRRAVDFLAPGGFLGIETEAMEIPGAPPASFFEFFPGNELSNDAGNWWSPNAKAIEGLTRAAGLEDFRLLRGPARRTRMELLRARLKRERTRFRAIASARKPA